MHEIEHRYLLHTLPDDIYRFADSVVSTVHVYIPGVEIQERFTKNIYIKNRDGGNYMFFRRTIKVGHGLKRLEFQEDIEHALYNRIHLALPDLPKVMKLRHHVIVGDVTFEVDRFLNRDLLLAEVEVPDVDSIVVLPEWLQSCVIREVTDELEFEGVNLAR